MTSCNICYRSCRLIPTSFEILHDYLTTPAHYVQGELKTQQKLAGDLDQEIKKLSGQQNLQQRIKHHAKIKVHNYFMTETQIIAPSS